YALRVGLGHLQLPRKDRNAPCLRKCQSRMQDAVHVSRERAQPAKVCCPHWRPSPHHQRTPVPLQRWHFTTLSPFLSKPLPSQFLHFCFFLMFGPFSLVMRFSCRQRAVDWRFVCVGLNEGDKQMDANDVAIFV